MKVKITHLDFNENTVNCLRYFVVIGKGRNRKLTFYDYVFYSTSKRVQINKFQLFYWEIDTLKAHFSIYN